MAWSQPSRRDLDNWVKLGNDGWGWGDLAPYFRKAERYHHSDVSKEDFDFDQGLHGADGPLQVCIASRTTSWMADVTPQTGKALGYPTPVDPRTGTSLGGFNQPITMDPELRKRSYAASAYYKPASTRPNLHVLTEAMASKICFEKSSGSDLTATGVQFLKDAMTYRVKTKEVLICSGVIQSPQVLELSGIGSTEILERYGIETLYDNPNVGENLQDHFFSALSWEAADGVSTFEELRRPEVMEALTEEYATSRTGFLADPLGVTAFVPYALAAGLEDGEIPAHIETLASSCSLGAQISPAQFSLLKEQLADPKEAAFQLVGAPVGLDMDRVDTSNGYAKHAWPGAYVSIAMCPTRSFSRGHVHIKSKSPNDYPEIDPGNLSHPMDVEMMARAALHGQAYATTKPFASFVKTNGTGEKVWAPGYRKLESLEDAKGHVRGHGSTAYHPIGTCAMLPEKEGGVVGPDLKVYGTGNVRVCDASVFPMHVQGNIQSLVYAVAEKTADIIKAARKRS